MWTIGLRAVTALAALGAGRAAAVEVLDVLPGVEVRGVSWTVAGPWLDGGTDLRRLALDSGPGGMLLRRRIELPVAAAEALAGDRLAALRGGDGSLALLDLVTGDLAQSPLAVSVLARDGQILLAAGAGGIWQGGLDTADPGLEPRLGPLPAAPAALCGREGLAWLVAADTLRGYGLDDPPLVLGDLPLPGVLRLAEREGRLLACRGEAGLAVVDLADPLVPVAWPWQPGFPALDALWWREQVFVVAAGDSGLALVDTALPEAPQLLGRWRTARRAERLCLRGDSLLVAQGAAGLSLHVLRHDGGAPRPDLLARHATRPRLLAVPWVSEDAFAGATFWCLDANQGFRRIDWPGIWWAEPPVESAGVALPTPVDGGDIAGGDWNEEPPLFAGCRYGAGLRYYEETEDDIVLRGIHPTDPVKLLAWGPDDLIAYVTPQAFVAIKQARRDPWMLLHHGTINLQAEPLCAAWSGHFLLVGCADGRVFCVNAEDPVVPVLEVVLRLAGPVHSLSASPYTYQNQVAAAAGPLYLLHRLAGDVFQVADSVQAAGDFVASSFTGYGVAAARDPDQVMEFFHWENTGLVLDEPVDLPASPLALARCLSTGSCGHALLGLDNGDLLRLSVVWEIGVDPPPARPGGLALRARPNPFNPTTRLEFTLAAAAEFARLAVFDLAGRAVARRELGALAAGDHELGLSAAGWPGGLYLARLEAGGRAGTTKLLLLK